jgi:hypothetical protein
MITKSGEKFVDITADMINEDNNLLIISGSKLSGDDILTDEDKATIELIITAQYPVQWIYDKIPFVSSEWAHSAVEYYLMLTTR